MSLRKKQKKECSWETKKIFFICILIKRSCDASFWNRLPITTRTQKDFQQPKTHRQSKKTLLTLPWMAFTL